MKGNFHTRKLGENMACYAVSLFSKVWHRGSNSSILNYFTNMILPGCSLSLLLLLNLASFTVPFINFVTILFSFTSEEPGPNGVSL